jgi:hypothetical protein
MTSCLGRAELTSQVEKYEKKKKGGWREFVYLIIYSVPVVSFLLDFVPRYIELKVDMCMSAVPVVNFLLDFDPRYIEVAQRLEWLVMRLLQPMSTL